MGVHHQLVKPQVLGVVAGLLLQVHRGPGPQLAVEVGECGPGGSDEVGLDGGHQERDGVGRARELGPARGPHR